MSQTEQWILVVNVLIQHLFLPAFFVSWLWRDKYSSRLRWISTAFLVSSYMAFNLLTGAWGWVGYPLRLAFLGLSLLGLLLTYRRARALPVSVPEPWKGKLDTGFRFALGAVFSLIVVYAVSGHHAGAGAVDLAFPLRDGVYLVGHGGNNPIINYHNTHSSQRYALDVLKLNRYGTRARGLYPRDLEAYAIYGDTVFSPCAGVVVSVRDGVPDLPPPQADKATPAGNSVAVECGDVVVHLAHLQRGSIQVQVGDHVTSGQPLGRVGNSGNTSEPHLHIHAELGPYTEGSSGRPGVPLRFQGRFLVRNSLVFSR